MSELQTLEEATPDPWTALLEDDAFPWVKISYDAVERGVHDVVLVRDGENFCVYAKTSRDGRTVYAYLDHNVNQGMFRGTTAGYCEGPELGVACTYFTLPPGYIIDAGPDDLLTSKARADYCMPVWDLAPVNGELRVHLRRFTTKKEPHRNPWRCYASIRRSDRHTMTVNFHRPHVPGWVISKDYAIPKDGSEFAAFYADVNLTLYRQANTSEGARRHVKAGLLPEVRARIATLQLVEATTSNLSTLKAS